MSVPSLLLNERKDTSRYSFATTCMAHIPVLAMYIFLSICSIIFYHAFVTTALGATCYFPSGDVATGNVPCNNNTDMSSCCASPSDCFANGLCLVNNDTDTVEFGRGGCTDQTWQSSNCFQQCTNDPTSEYLYVLLFCLMKMYSLLPT